ncbi:CdaR family transcriptional regulator [Streptomyces sp. NP160]|uniref:PucR family transcriptional regulator n=1 Tax=Streptomyces sp. NP160 TaxID=2586637 RepID=UPI0027D8DA84|nr:helix-turn-helix domain-containing protein [Streptomyces sp. NP160]
MTGDAFDDEPPGVVPATTGGAWPELSDAARELFRRGAQTALDLRARWVERLHEASLGSGAMRAVAADPVLAAAVRRTNEANLLQWATANVRHPGARVPAGTGPEALATARDLVRRGLDQRALEAYRAVQGVVWRQWTATCFELTTDPALLRELLDVSALSISTFLDDTVAAVVELVGAERAELTRGAHAERRAAVTLLLEGAPLSRARAEAQLGYGLTGPHTAAVVWTTDTGSDQLEAAADAVARAAGAGRRLTVVAGATALWLWLPVAGEVAVAEVAAHLAAGPAPSVRVALGRAGHDVEGFRRSHLDALTTQRLLARLTSPQQVARYQDVQLVDLLTRDPARVEELVADVLGPLADAPPELRDTVLTHVRELGSVTRTAQRLFTHRNTVLRRLARADELLPRPLAQDALAVAAALEVLRWQEDRSLP